MGTTDEARLMYYRIIENLILAGLAALIIVALFLALNFAQGTL